MFGWTLTNTHPTQGRTFRRPLGPIELTFLLDGHFNGSTDSVHHAELRLLNASQDAHLFLDANIVRAWLSTKRRHPLVGATVHFLPVDASGGDPTVTSEPHFVVREHDLSVLRPHEIVFGEVASSEGALQRISTIWDGPRPLSDDLLVQVYVFRETDRADILHLMTLTAHCVTDGMANRTLMRCLVDSLARDGDPSLEPTQIPLEERLEMVIPTGDLEPAHLRSLSVPGRRWKRAVGAVIFRLRMTRQGGHTLPCRQTCATPYTPSRPGFLSTSLSQTQTNTVLANCRTHGLTFGQAYLALAQVAMTRVLSRRYLRGDISEEEWTYRKRQPYRAFGSLNLRPYLDKPWYESGGGGEFMVSISMYTYQLPFMTLGGTDRQCCHGQQIPDGAPPFSDLLTFRRFLYRAGLVKKQARTVFAHPLFLEIIHATGQGFARRARRRQKERETVSKDATDEEVLAVTDMPSVIAHGGSSLGNLHLIFPTEYPLPPTHPLSPFSPVSHPARAGYVSLPLVAEVDAAPRIVVEHAMTYLHTSPAELYLGTLTSHGRLKVYSFYDRNVYEEGVVSEWLDEVKGAVLWYLGRTHRPVTP